ncbi:hypothetical protein [Bacillus sp. FJAT-27445]|uniref:hypothetical protein n=1 Tax=Bacillus sp. FJAT-27445 TaxID=1679166 RepID=UPI000743784E|nr:hypothetical protein [Bacillus sp. FJAT-27445]
MDEKGIHDILDRLKSGQIAEYYVANEDFLPFRKTLVMREDFKHFRGIAQRGGNVIYEYTPEERS